MTAAMLVIILGKLRKLGLVEKGEHRAVGEFIESISA
jgi:hypothetical protein